MDSKEIEAQIKGLLGLQLGAQATEPIVPPGAYPRQKNRPGKNTEKEHRPFTTASKDRARRPNGPLAVAGQSPGKQHAKLAPEILDVSRASAEGSERLLHPPQQRRDRKQSGQRVKNGKAPAKEVKKENRMAEAKGADPEAAFILEAKEELRCENPEDFVPSDAVVEFMAGKHLRLLKKKSAKFPRARWFCDLCEYHCDNLAKCGEHYRDTRHSRLTRAQQMEFTLIHLPKPNKQHLNALNSLLMEVEREKGLSQGEMQTRQAVAHQVQALLHPHIPGCKVRLYGSSLTGFGLKNCNINLDMQLGQDQLPHLALFKALEILRESGQFRNVTDDFTVKMPAIKFFTESGLECELSLNNQQAYQTSALLADYITLDPRVRTLGIAFRYWASITKLDRQAEGTLSPHTFAILLIFFLQQMPQPLVPCIPLTVEDAYCPDRERLSSWRSESSATPAQLWLNLFRFYSLEFNSSEQVVSIRSLTPLTIEQKEWWKSKRLAIEDPYSRKRSLCRSIQHSSVYNYIADCFKLGCLYFGTVQTSLGPVITSILPPSAVDGGRQDEDEEVRPVGCSEWTLESWLASKGTVLTRHQAHFATALVPRNMVSFDFLACYLTDGTVPAIQCVVCGSEGHLPSKCPEEQLPPLVKLPNPPPQYIQLLDSVCQAVARDWTPQFHERRERDTIMFDLNRYIRKFWPDAELTVFGSSGNGFAFRHSDLDISLTFKDKPTAENLDSIELIQILAEKLKRMMGVRNVLAITSAKVPIVKLLHHHSQIEADISLYNVLARENTRLLYTYSELDPRVRILGYMVKLFAKVCDIGDASRGSLSSYAYILMMIFYLQQVDPPVIPVLQEMHNGTQPQSMVDGWNAWFQSDRKKLSEWKSENRQSLAHLWIGFLSFYAGDWDDRRLVVCIRQKKPLTKFEKMWNLPCIAIEDPFELNHNLGAGISRKMNLYIKKTFINARHLFGTPFNFIPQGYRTYQDYFFDPNLLTDGAPPNDRGCRACGKIGHLVADCPRKRAADNRRKANAKERQRTQSEKVQERDESEKEATAAVGGRSRTATETGLETSSAAPSLPSSSNKGKIQNDARPGTGDADAMLRNLQHEPAVLPPFGQPLPAHLLAHIPPPPAVEAAAAAGRLPVGDAPQLAGMHHPSGNHPPLRHLSGNPPPVMGMPHPNSGQPGRPSGNATRPRNMSNSSGGSQPGIDLGALAAMIGAGAAMHIGGKAPPPVSAINLEDLERSFLTDSGESGGVGGRGVAGPPPGFGGMAATTPPPTSFTQQQLFDSLQLQLQLQHQMNSQAQQSNHMLLPFLPIGIPLHPRLAMGPIGSGLAPLGGALGGLPNPFAPVQPLPRVHPFGAFGLGPFYGQHGGGGGIFLGGGGSELPPLPIGSLPGLAPQAFPQNIPPGVIGPSSSLTSPLATSPVALRSSPPLPFLPPARRQEVNSSPEGSIPTAPSPLPMTTADSPQVLTPPPPLLIGSGGGGWPSSSFFNNNSPQHRGSQQQNQQQLLLGQLRPAVPPFGGPFSPFQTHQTGFHSSVLFPSDIRHPMAPHPSQFYSGGEEGVGELVEEGSPLTPPPINMAAFDLDSLDPVSLEPTDSAEG